MQDFRAEPHFLHPARAEILHQYLCSRNELQKNFPRLFIAQVQPNAPLVAGIDFPCRLHAVVAPGPERVAFGRIFNLDDLRPEVGKLQGEHVSCDDA